MQPIRFEQDELFAKLSKGKIHIKYFKGIPYYRVFCGGEYAGCLSKTTRQQKYWVFIPSPLFTNVMAFKTFSLHKAKKMLRRELSPYHYENVMMWKKIRRVLETEHEQSLKKGD